MELPHNYLKYPNIMQKPYSVDIGGDEYQMHSYRFRGLQEFYDFLKSEPNVNCYVFSPNELSSEKGKSDFAGKPYDFAINDLILDIDPGYQEYLKIQKRMKAKMGSTHQYKKIKSIAGGSIDPVAYSTGSPEIYRASRIIQKPKFITIDTQIAYFWGTTRKQVFHRALIITNLIKALENNGYSVNVNSFMLVEDDDEMIKAIFEVKKRGHLTNYQTLYKSLVNVEFFRRLCFRLIEVADVKNEWCYGYGKTCSKEIAREVLKLGKNDIYFDQPRDMGIKGRNIEEDFRNVVDCLKIQDVIDVNREVEHLKQGIKVLEKKK